MTGSVDTRNAYRPMSQEVRRRSLHAVRGCAFLILVKSFRISCDQYCADLSSPVVIPAGYSPDSHTPGTASSYRFFTRNADSPDGRLPSLLGSGQIFAIWRMEEAMLAEFNSIHKQKSVAQSTTDVEYRISYTSETCLARRDAR